MYKREEEKSACVYVSVYRTASVCVRVGEIYNENRVFLLGPKSVREAVVVREDALPWCAVNVGRSSAASIWVEQTAHPAPVLVLPLFLCFPPPLLSPSFLLSCCV